MKVTLKQTDTLQLKPSPIHGIGVFAKSDIPKDSLLAVWEHGTEMSWAEFKKIYGGDTRYCYMRMPWQDIIVDKERKNIITFVNDGVHGQQQPHHNCVLQGRGLWSLENIPAGSEILLKYHKRYPWHLR